MRDTTPLDALKQHFDRWSALLTSTAPIDRTVAEDAIRQSYQAAGLSPPERIVWCGSPVQIAKELAAASASDCIGDNVKEQIFEAPRDRAKLFGEIFWKEILIAANEGPGRRSIDRTHKSWENAKALNASVDRVASKAAFDILYRVSVRARHSFERWRGLPRLLPQRKFTEIAVGPADFAVHSTYEYLRDVVDWKEQTVPIDGLMTLATTGCWLVPHESTCWIAERPQRLRSDDSGRLHCANGPALVYGDGWSLFAWKGVTVPAWMIERQKRITIDKIDNMFEPILRNTMIDIMTPERFIRLSSPQCVSRDETGILWRKSWSVRQVPIGSWCAVEVVNGSAEPDGSHKNYVLRVPTECRTAREAVAWTYGMTAAQYAKLEVRT